VRPVFPTSSILTAFDAGSKMNHHVLSTAKHGMRYL
jgi:hypothetical protein